MQILTLNIWGVPYAKHCATRLQLIADKVLELSPDVLCFQEVYLPGCPKILIDRLKAQYPYSHHFASGLVGSGLLTLSKYPIVDAAFHRFRMGGKPLRLEHGDYYAGKGIGFTRISTPQGFVDVYNSHTHAQYQRENDNEYAVYTNTNLYEAIRFIHAYSDSNAVILCGDLNTRPDQLGYRILTQMGNLSDAYFGYCQQYPITYAAANPYTHDFNQCLDYVLTRSATVQKIELALNETLSGKAQAYSDHYALMAEVDIQTPPSEKAITAIAPVLEALLKEVEIAMIETENEQMNHVEHALLGFSGVLDGNLLANFLGRYFKSLAKLIRFIVVFVGIGYGVLSLMQAGINLQSRRATLQAIYQELKLQVAARRLFDGSEW
jgi:sphingomyelin phosphodiesterase 2